jgi:hypothetical protein
MNITAQALIDIRNSLLLPLVYAVHESVEPGKVYQIAATDVMPETFIFHSQEEAETTARKAKCRLVHIRDWHSDYHVAGNLRLGY